MPALLRDAVMNGRGISVADASVKEKQEAFDWILTDMEEQERYTVQKTVKQVKKPLTSYIAEGCGILDNLRFLRQQGISKKTPVSIFCDNLSGVQRSSDVEAPYRWWVGIDDNVYGAIRHELRHSNWMVSHVKRHQNAAQIQESLRAKLNNDTDALAKECVNAMLTSKHSWNNISTSPAKEGVPVLLNKGLLISSGIAKALRTAHNKNMKSVEMFSTN